jgi:GR25 family glycosyltransferase involved in LPS biosynthesis
MNKDQLLTDDKIYVINMKSNFERYNNMKKNLYNISINDWNLYQAIDGKKLTFNDCKHIVDFETFNNSKKDYRLSNSMHCLGSIGCFLSHYNIWKILAENDFGKNWYMIMEDDIEFPSHFSFKVEKYIKDLDFGNNPNVGYLSIGEIGSGSHQFGFPKNLEMKELKKFKLKYSKGKQVDLDSIDGSIILNARFTGASCYIISKLFAKQLIKTLEFHRANLQLDWWLSFLRTEEYPIFHAELPIVNLSELHKKSDILHTPVK